MTPPRDDATPAYAHALARAIHERDCTPNRADQFRMDSLAAWKVVDLVSAAGLELRFSRAALEGSAERG